MTATITASNGAGTTAPQRALLPYEPTLRSRNVIHKLIGGGIAAYKSLDLIRRLRERGASVRCVMTAAARQFFAQELAGTSR